MFEKGGMLWWAEKGDGGEGEKFEGEMDLEVEGYIGERYVREGKEKIDMYKGFRGI